MPYALLADEFHSDPKTVSAGLAGAGLYTRALSYCAHHSTDGFVPAGWAREVAPAPVRRKVVAAGLWIEVTGGETYHYVSGTESYTVTIVAPGYFIPDYLAYNPTRASVLARRSELSQKRSEAGKKGAAARWQRDNKPDGKRMATDMANGWPPSPTPKEPSKGLFVARPEQPPEEIREAIDLSLKGAA